jgi:predicted acyltransferase
MVASLVLLKAGKLSLPVTAGRKTYVALLVGIILLLGGGLYDFWWRTTFGFADTTWTPSHMTATAGFLILLITGVIGLGRNSGPIVKGAFIYPSPSPQPSCLP